MPWILIKNNLKLMLRSKWILIMMTIMPVLVAAILANVFHDMLSVNCDTQEFNAGYRIEEAGLSDELFTALQESCNAAGITLVDYEEGEIETYLTNQTVPVFVDITKDGYTIYKATDAQIQSMMLDTIVSNFFYQVDQSTELAVLAMQGEGQTDLQPQEADVETQELELTPIADSTDYYGIVYILYFTWCGMISLTAVITSERKNHIGNRLAVTPVSRFQLYLGQFVPCVIATLIEVLVAVALDYGLLGVKFGNPLGTLGILVLLDLATVAFGIVLFAIFHNLAAAIVAAWLCVFGMGFTGGSFQTYMYNTIPDSIAKLSPQYYVNRTVVEFSTMGHSDYAVKCALILGAIILVAGLLGVSMLYRRKEA